jgi:hypothetical protein
MNSYHLETLAHVLEFTTPRQISKSDLHYNVGRNAFKEM